MYPNLWNWDDNLIASISDKFPKDLVKNLVEIEDDVLNDMYRT